MSKFSSSISSSFDDVTSELHTVQGGNKGRAIANGARAAWNAAKPYAQKAWKAVEGTATIGGAIAAGREAWNWATGGKQQQPAQPQP